MNKQESIPVKGKSKAGLTKRDKHTIRFLKWTRQYCGWWELICTPGDENMTLEMIKSWFNVLLKNSSMRLLVHREAPFMDGLFKCMLLDMILAGWEGKVKGKEQIIHDTTDLSA